MYVRTAGRAHPQGRCDVQSALAPLKRGGWPVVTAGCDWRSPVPDAGSRHFSVVTAGTAVPSLPMWTPVIKVRRKNKGRNKYNIFNHNEEEKLT